MVVESAALDRLNGSIWLLGSSCDTGEFADNGEVVSALDTLIEREGDPLVVKLPRTPGRKDSEYMHLFAGEVDVAAYAEQAAAAPTRSSRGNLTDLEQRVAALEAEVSALKQRLDR